MSLDLTVAQPLSTTLQAVQDQNGNPSPLQLATDQVSLSNNQLHLTSLDATNQFHIVGYTPSGDTDFWSCNSQLVFQQGGDSPKALMILPASGVPQLPALPNLPATGTVDLVVDSTGKISTQTSSVRFKDDVQTLRDDFHKVLSLEPRSFVNKHTGERGIGYVAEELEQLDLADLLGYDPDGKPLTVHYKLLPIYLVEILKEQRQMLAQLQVEITQLKGQMR